ncbi:MAG TPA: F0F1 ATP synthase subunit B [Patescibacteria group bacterium]|nr:F0F1 ATP synthase subunit B [Patescibacteria group bacterium]
MGTQLLNPEVGTIIWTLITFVVLLFLLSRFAWKPFTEFLDAREKSIRDAIEGAQRARAEAEETLKKNEELLMNARRETAALLEQGRRETETLRAELLVQARKEAQDLVEQGKKQIAYEQKQAIETLRGQVADLAIGAAGRLIQGNLDDAKNRALVADYVKGLPTRDAGHR